MLKKRPTLPSGHAFAGIPPVQRALHTDGDVELYRLEPVQGQPNFVLLVSARSSAQEWLEAQHPRILSLDRTLAARECPAGWAGFVLSIRGCRLRDDDAAASRERLEPLFAGLVDLARVALQLKRTPDLSPDLLWGLPGEGIVGSVVSHASGWASEADGVREVARAFYLIATGIDVRDVGASVPPLVQWSKTCSQELSRVIERCLSPSSPREAITSMLGLDNAIGRPVSPTQEASVAAPQSSAAPSAFARGLGKVAGMRELKELLRREVVDPLRNPEPYKRYGLSIPNGLLMYGPPGCGKTYIARQLAEELDHYFVEVIPSELAGIYVHQSVIKIRELFDSAAEHAPAVVFIDEFEALVPAREHLGGHQQYKSEEVNEFLAQLNGCAERNIFVIAATNRPEKIDGAVRRTGRLDKLIYVGPPDQAARHDMLALHLEGRPIAPDLDLDTLAQLLPGYSASDLRFLVDEAARESLRRQMPITMASFRAAMGRVPPSVTPQVAADYQSISQRGS